MRVLVWRWVVFGLLSMAASAASGEHVAQVSADGVQVMIDPAVHAGQALSAARVLHPVEFSETPIELTPFPELWLLALPEVRPQSPSWWRLALTTATAEQIEVAVWVDPQATVLGPVRSGQTLWRLGRQAAELDLNATGRSAGEWVAALHALNPAAFEAGAMDGLQQGALLAIEPPPVETVVELPAEWPVERPVDERAAEPSVEPSVQPMPLTDPSTRQRYSPINPITGVAGMVVVVVIALLALWKAMWRRAPSDPRARLATHFAERGRPDLARGWWAEALLKSESEPQRQRLRQRLKDQPAQQEASLER
jgi:hypothetical protein